MRPYCQFGSSASHGFHCSRLEHILAPPAQGLWRNGSAPDQKVGSSNLSGLIYSPFALSMSTHTGNTKTYSKLKNPKKLRFGIDKPKANTANHCEPGDNYLFPTSSQLSFLSHWTFWAWLYLLQGIHAVGGTERVRAGERLQ